MIYFTTTKKSLTAAKTEIYGKQECKNLPHLSESIINNLGCCYLFIYLSEQNSTNVQNYLS